MSKNNVAMIYINLFTAVRTYDVCPNLSSDNAVMTYVVHPFRGGITPRPNQCQHCQLDVCHTSIQQLTIPFGTYMV